MHVSGNSGDSLAVTHNGRRFSTKDSRDNDLIHGTCGQLFKEAWWYRKCHKSNLNGLYLRSKHTSYADGVNWHSWNGYYYTLEKTEMKIRPYKSVFVRLR